jgi:hypothetical protein
MEYAFVGMKGRGRRLVGSVNMTSKSDWDYEFEAWLLQKVPSSMHVEPQATFLVGYCTVAALGLKISDDNAAIRAVRGELGTHSTPLPQLVVVYCTYLDVDT